MKKNLLYLSLLFLIISTQALADANWIKIQSADDIKSTLEFGASNRNLTYLSNRINPLFKNTENTAQNRNYRYYINQFIIGELTGVGIGLATGICTAPVISRNNDDLAGLGYLLVTIYSGYSIGNSVGVYYHGKKRHNGSYIKTLVGAISGTVLGLYLFSASDQKGPLSAMPLLGPTIGSMIGFNAFRKADALYSMEGNNYSYTTVKFNLISVNF